MSKVELVLGWTALESALPAYLEAERYWSGKIDEVFADPKIQRELSRTGERYRFNLIKTAINVRSSRCELAAVKIADDEAGTGLVTEVWKANTLAVHYPILIRDSFIFGDSYLMAWPVDSESDALIDDELATAKVEIVTKDPKNTRVIYDKETGRRKWFAINRWCVPQAGGAERWRADLYFADSIERYISTEAGALATEDGWTEYLEPDEMDAQWLQLHDMGEVPFFHHRTDVPYGVPVHHAGYGAQDAVNKELITLLTTTDSQGFPQRYALLDKDAVLDDQNDDPQWTDDSYSNAFQVDSVLGKNGQSGALRSGPGTMQTLTGMKSVGQFAAADPATFLDPAEFFIRLMAQVTNTPLHYFETSKNRDSPSGESLKVAEAPLVKDIQWLQLLQEGAVEEEWKFVLGLLAHPVTDVDVRWASVASVTGLSDWQEAQVKIEVGVPVDQVLTEAGYEPEQVAKWLDADAEASTLATRVALLASIGAAVQSIGAGIALGVVDEALAQQTVALVLGQVNASGQGVDPA